MVLKISIVSIAKNFKDLQELVLPQSTVVIMRCMFVGISSTSFCLVSDRSSACVPHHGGTKFL
jgi:hypothetical protein